MLTGNLSLRPYSIVSEILYDEQKRKAKGVRVIDAQTKESNRFPNGFGNGSEQIGHNLMDHHFSAGVSGIHDGFQDKYYKGRRPCGFLIPRYRNLKGQEQMNFLRGYNLQGHGERREWMDTLSLTEGFGSDFKKKLSQPGPWTVWMAGWGECLPYYDNKVSLDENKKDEYGVPLVKIDFSFRENEHTMMQDIQETSAEMLKKSGFKDIDVFNYQKPGGTTVHEMGTARMGRSAKDSVLNANNQMHEVKNVFITDGSCMTSSACQNPSLTYMALTARACDFAYNELKKGN
eukprot:gene23586-28110_t